MPSRTEKVASLLQREVSQTLQREMSDPRLDGMISITRVKVSDDLSQALVFVSVLPREHESRVIAALTDAAGHIQRKTKPRVAMRVMPRLQFRLDESLKKQADVLAAIREAAERTSTEGSSDTKDLET
ncbi:MAG: 30S ribosome-binding factor RbfA [Phycisphaeraceae bacterium]|nr:30S ribosome-binding factor RbfA [Phycisphaeraceae bacterium]